MSILGRGEVMLEFARDVSLFLLGGAPGDADTRVSTRRIGVARPGASVGHRTMNRSIRVRERQLGHPSAHPIVLGKASLPSPAQGASRALPGPTHNPGVV